MAMLSNQRVAHKIGTVKNSFGYPTKMVQEKQRHQIEASKAGNEYQGDQKQGVPNAHAPPSPRSIYPIVYHIQ